MRRLLEDNNNKRLMLVTVPESNLYSIQRMSLILAHETSHFVGTNARKREKRFYTWMIVSARILELELLYFLYDEMVVKKKWVEALEKENNNSQYIEIAEEIRKNIKIPNSKMKYYSKESMDLIKQAYYYTDFSNIKYYCLDIVQNSIKAFLEKQNEGHGKKQKQVRKIIESTQEFIQLDMKLEKRFDEYCRGMLWSILPQLKYISAEMFADIMGIMTLELTPKEYLSSFCEEGAGFLKPDEKKNGILQFRVGIVVLTIKKLTENWDMNSAGWLEEFSKHWKKGITANMIKEFPEGTNKRFFAAKIYGYLDEITDYYDKIKNYESVYSDTNMRQATNNTICFFNDKVVVEELSEYLYECAKYFATATGVNFHEKSEEYAETLRKDADDRNYQEKKKICELKKELVNTYKILSGKSETAVMQEIEEYLFKYDLYAGNSGNYIEESG